MTSFTEEDFSVFLNDSSPEFVEEFSAVISTYQGSDCSEESDLIFGGDFESSAQPQASNSETECWEPHYERQCDIDESFVQSDFLFRGCGCSRKCSTTVNWSELCDYRNHCLELTKQELDISIKSQLYLLRKNGSHTSGNKKIPSERQKPHQEYMFHGEKCCRALFAFAHGVHVNTVKKIGVSLDSEGLSSRRHGNSGKIPHNALTQRDYNNISKFIEAYADDHALPLPGRLPSHRDYSVMLLPSDTTKYAIYQSYIGALDASSRQVSYFSFLKVWKELCPFVSTMRPSTDLCLTCQQNMTLLSKTANSDIEKMKHLRSFEAHLDCVRMQSQQYKAQVSSAKEVATTLPEWDPFTVRPPCSMETTWHYSFDFAQQVHYPSNPQQPGPIYFATPRKVNIFGICEEGISRQVFYLIDEGHNPGKGANATISMLHHHLETYGLGETDTNIHFDNCVGQNLNNPMMWYLLWRCMTGRHQTITVNTMVTGHTKFAPDWFFGLFKRRWKVSVCSTLDHICDVVNRCTRGGQCIPVKSSDVFFYQWSDYLCQFFTSIPLITRYHHFSFSHSEPGVVTVREFANSDPVQIELLKTKTFRFPHLCRTLPEKTEIKEMPSDRQWYLYEKIRPFCPEEFRDQCCPLPQVPKVICGEAPPRTAPKRPSRCSYCKEPGHTKTVRGLIKCPKLVADTVAASED